MTMLDLSAAARLVGRDVSTLHRAMVSGRLSFTKPHRQAPARPGRARTGVRDQGYHYQSDLSRQRRRSRPQCAPGRNDSPSARTARDRSRRKAAHVGAADRAAGAVVAAVVQMSGCAGEAAQGRGLSSWRTPDRREINLRPRNLCHPRRARPLRAAEGNAGGFRSSSTLWAVSHRLRCHPELCRQHDGEVALLRRPVGPGRVSFSLLYHPPPRR